ncbi:MAG: ParB/RepB/Spo0J family partition protein [Armatimonadetes bacterium]|nr:ParB/RepB/Spo0J family partition protein [Armatimonadota bacterium]MBS1712627.1 ParB/RepB/Spo0J family partition protein [Armatimonadota bacterium]MBX3109922.1 ParB/RepB/Spo0J family partition protein [Fimbriimonadaceae bacterium]
MRRALGKGLSQLLGEQAEESANVLPVGSIKTNSRQPRTQFDDEKIAELAASIREFGVLQPLIVRPLAEGEYELIAGERRLRASKLAGLAEVPVIVRAASAQASLEIALIENVQREDITPMECALAYRKLADEFGLSQEQIAQRVGKSRVAISNTMRLLKLPERITQAIYSGELSEGHARALLMVESPVRQAALFERIIREGLSVREAEKLARSVESPRLGGQKPRSVSAPAHSDPNWLALEQGLSEYFGTPVQLAADKVGGKMTISFYSDEDLQRILDVLGVSL